MVWIMCGASLVPVVGCCWWCLRLLLLDVYVAVGGVVAGCWLFLLAFAVGGCSRLMRLLIVAVVGAAVVCCC